MLQMNREDRWTVMGVFDGHGMWDGKVASAVRDGMVRAMKDVDGRKMNGSDPETVCSRPLSAVVQLLPQMHKWQAENACYKINFVQQRLIFLCISCGNGMLRI